jgi:cbb3-type cytochrome oxidase subunit 3
MKKIALLLFFLLVYAGESHALSRMNKESIK